MRLVVNRKGKMLALLLVFAFVAICCVRVALPAYALPVDSGTTGVVAAQGKLDKSLFGADASPFELSWTGRTVTPKLRVYYGSKTLKVGRDYKAAVPNSKAAGTYKIKVTGKGKYAGLSSSAYYRILPHSRNVGAWKLKGKRLDLTWKTYPDGTDRYIFVCSGTPKGIKGKYIECVLGEKLDDKWDIGYSFKNDYIKKKWGAGHVRLDIGKYLKKTYKKKYIYVCMFAYRGGHPDAILDDDYGLSASRIVKVKL